MPGTNAVPHFPVSLNISISTEWDRLVAEEVDRRGVSKSQVIRDFITNGIDEYFTLVDEGAFPGKPE